jgi:hypothetical protein
MWNIFRAFYHADCSTVKDIRKQSSMRLRQYGHCGGNVKF